MTGHREDPTVVVLERALGWPWRRRPDHRCRDPRARSGRRPLHARSRVPRWTLGRGRRRERRPPVAIDRARCTRGPARRDSRRCELPRLRAGAMVEAVARLRHALEYAGVFCVNPATSVAMWEDKLTQLVVADQVGLATPTTRYLCDLSAAADFADAHGGESCTSPSRRMSGRRELMNTSPSSTRKWCRRTSCASRPVTSSSPRRASSAGRPQGVRAARGVRRRHDLRCRIESQQSTVADKDWDATTWRTHPYLVHELDATVEGQIGDLMRRMNLSFGSLDFIVTPEGEHVFLEVNPVGQFGWTSADRPADLRAAGRAAGRQGLRATDRPSTASPRAVDAPTELRDCGAAAFASVAWAAGYEVSVEEARDLYAPTTTAPISSGHPRGAGRRPRVRGRR